MEMTGYHQPGDQSVKSPPPRRRLNYVVLTAAILGGITAILLGIAVATNYWFQSTKGLLGKRNFGMWQDCYSFRGCRKISDGADVYFLVFRALLLGSLGLILLSCLFLILSIKHIHPKCLASVAGVFLIFAVMAMGGVNGLFIFTYIRIEDYNFLSVLGYSLILSLVANITCFLASVFSYVGACVVRQEPHGGVVIA